MTIDELFPHLSASTLAAIIADLNGNTPPDGDIDEVKQQAADTAFDALTDIVGPDEGGMLLDAAYQHVSPRNGKP